MASKARGRALQPAQLDAWRLFSAAGFALLSIIAYMLSCWFFENWIAEISVGLGLAVGVWIFVDTQVLPREARLLAR